MYPTRGDDVQQLSMPDLDSGREGAIPSRPIIAVSISRRSLGFEFEVSISTGI